MSAKRSATICALESLGGASGGGAGSRGDVTGFGGVIGTGLRGVDLSMSRSGRCMVHTDRRDTHDRVTGRGAWAKPGVNERVDTSR